MGRKDWFECQSLAHCLPIVAETTSSSLRPKSGHHHDAFTFKHQSSPPLVQQHPQPPLVPHLTDQLALVVQLQKKSRESRKTNIRESVVSRWKNTYQVIPQQLHDQCGILVAFLAQSVELSNRIVESLLGKVASLVGRVEDLVVEDREVEGKAKSDWMSRSKVGLSDLSGGLVCFKRLVGGLLSLLGSGEFGKVTVIITLPVKSMSTRSGTRKRPTYIL